MVHRHPPGLAKLVSEASQDTLFPSVEKPLDTDTDTPSAPTETPGTSPTE